MLMTTNGEKAKNEILYLSGLPVNIGGLLLCDMGMQRTESGHTYGPAVRDFTLVHFVLRGKGSYCVDGTTYALGAGDCFCIKPDAVTTYSADTVNPWQYLWFGLRGSDGARIIGDAFGERLTSAYDPALLSDAERLFAGSGLGANLRVAACIFKLLSSVYDNGEPAAPKKPDIVSEAVSYIENSYYRGFDITELSRRLGVSRAHFTAVFSASMGVSPYRYLLDYRLQRAAELLMRSPALTVEETAYSVGFASLQRFSEMFKKAFGMSPLRYRAHHSDRNSD